MKRTSVMLPEDLTLLLDQERRRRDVSAAEIVREALESYFLKSSDGPKRVLRIAALGRSGGPIAHRMEEELAEEARSDEGLRRMMFGEEPEHFGGEGSG